jgi:choice-of-anchor B domain-containing protein
LLFGAVASPAHEETEEAIESIIHDLEEAGDISASQHRVIERLAFQLDKHDQLQRWIDAHARSGRLTTATKRYLEAVLGLYQPEVEASLTPAAYSGNGTVVPLGHLDVQPPSASQIYNGIWGYAAGSREYALQTNSLGLHILDITDPTAPYRLQFIAMPGGTVWRDVDTHRDPTSGKTFAYIGAQSNGNLWVVDLSWLSSSTAHGVDSDPIPAAAMADRGRTNYGHTIFINDGLLFMNSANSGSTLGCQIFDLLQDPFDPPVIASWSGSQRDCHDSYARANVAGTGGKDILYSADGYTRRYRLLDITGVRSGGSPTLLGETDLVPGTYAHSNWLSDDSQHLYVFEEFNEYDLGVYDVSNPLAPSVVTTFQYSDDDANNSRVHNGQVRGDYLFVAYYEAGLRVFDISNPANPVEVGKLETWRDPDGDGTFNRGVSGEYDGAWNLHTLLPSGNVLVSDTESGTFIVRSDPVATPAAPATLSAGAGNAQVSLSWSGVNGSTGYSVHRSTSNGGPYTKVATQVVGTTYSDEGLASGTTYYYITTATNAGGESAASDQAEATPFSAPVCGDGLCDTGEDCDSCVSDCPSFSVGGALCGNAVCEVGDGEDCVNCASDCAGVQKGKPSGRFCCGFGGSNPVGCGDSACSAGGLSCTETPIGPAGTTCCGDLTCEDPEDGSNCTLDCGAPPFCGDTICNASEDQCSCTTDCGAPPASEVTQCSDGQDNDCDLDVDCNDADCSADPACQASDCASIASKRACNAEQSCLWNNRTKVCVEN